MLFSKSSKISTDLKGQEKDLVDTIWLLREQKHVLGSRDLDEKLVGLAILHFLQLRSQFDRGFNVDAPRMRKT